MFIGIVIGILMCVALIIVFFAGAAFGSRTIRKMEKESADKG